MVKVEAVAQIDRTPAAVACEEKQRCRALFNNVVTVLGRPVFCATARQAERWRGDDLAGLDAFTMVLVGAQFEFYRFPLRVAASVS